MVTSATTETFKNGCWHVQVGGRPLWRAVDMRSRELFGSDAGSRRLSAPMLPMFVSQFLAPYYGPEDTR